VEQEKNNSRKASLQNLNTLFPEDAMETAVMCVTHWINSAFSLVEPENPEEDFSDSEEPNTRKKKKRLNKHHPTTAHPFPASLVRIFSPTHPFLIQDADGRSIDHN
jgi:hypothetical protein